MDDPDSTADDTDADEASDVDADGDDSSAGDNDQDGTTDAVEDGTPGFSVGITLLAIVVSLAAGQRFRDPNRPEGKWFENR